MIKAVCLRTNSPTPKTGTTWRCFDFLQGDKPSDLTKGIESSKQGQPYSMNQVQQEYEDCKMLDMEQKLQPMYQWFFRSGKCWFHDKLAESAPIPDHYIQPGALLGFLNVCSVVFRIHGDQSLQLCGQQSQHHHQRHVKMLGLRIRSFLTSMWLCLGCLIVISKRYTGWFESISAVIAAMSWVTTVETTILVCVILSFILWMSRLVTSAASILTILLTALLLNAWWAFGWLLVWVSVGVLWAFAVGGVVDQSFDVVEIFFLDFLSYFV